MVICHSHVKLREGFSIMPLPLVRPVFQFAICPPFHDMSGQGLHGSGPQLGQGLYYLGAT